MRSYSFPKRSAMVVFRLPRCRAVCAAGLARLSAKRGQQRRAFPPPLNPPAEAFPNDCTRPLSPPTHTHVYAPLSFVRRDHPPALRHASRFLIVVGQKQTFEQDVDTLGTIPLHPALVSASGAMQHAQKQGGGMGGGSGAGSSSGSVAGGKTLLDCIPVEREQRLLESCRTSQRRFRVEGDNVALKYSAVEEVCMNVSVPVWGTRDFCTQ